MSDAVAMVAPLDLARRAVLERWRLEGATTVIEATGTSMIPFIRLGDRLVVQFGALPNRSGEVILFVDGIVVAHRVVARSSSRAGGPDWMLTKGDAEPYATESVVVTDVLGVVRAVERGGLASPGGLGDVRGAIVAGISRLAGILERASRRRPAPIGIPLGLAASMARFVLFHVTASLASARGVESAQKGGEPR
jgi:hypothetical protein